MINMKKYKDKTLGVNILKGQVRIKFKNWNTILFFEAY